MHSCCFGYSCVCGSIDHLTCWSIDPSTCRLLCVAIAACLYATTLCALDFIVNQRSNEFKTHLSMRVFLLLVHTIGCLFNLGISHVNPTRSTIITNRTLQTDFTQLSTILLSQIILSCCSFVFCSVFPCFRPVPALLSFCHRVYSFGDRMFLLRGGVCNNALHLFSSASFISLVCSSSIICLTLCSLVRRSCVPFLVVRFLFPLCSFR